MSGVFLKLDQFEGPLDLLLNLIKVNEIDIFNIDLLALGDQYLRYLRLVSFSDLIDAGDFVEMAASLVEIKSSMLLPKDETDQPDEDDKNDPGVDLKKRLLEYEAIQKAGNYLGSRPQLGVEIHSSQEWRRLLPQYDGIEAPLTGDPASLVILYEMMLQNLLEKKPEAKVHAITHRIGLGQVTGKIKKLLKTVKFTLFQSFYKDFESRYELIVYILAVLEMSRWGDAKIYQEGVSGPLWVYGPEFDVNQLPINKQLAPLKPKEPVDAQR